MSKEKTLEQVKADLVKAEAKIEKQEADAVEAEKVAKEKQEQKDRDKKTQIHLEARVKGVDKDGNKAVLSFESIGATAEEVLENLKFPKGLNSLVTLILRRDGNKIEFTIAPHKARRMLFDKDTHDLEVNLKNMYYLF